MRRLTLLCLSVVVALLSTIPNASAQRIHVYGRVSSVQAEEPSRLAAACASCTVGTPISFEFALADPNCTYPCRDVAWVSFNVHPQSRNTVTVEVGSESWKIYQSVVNFITTFSDRNHFAVHFGALTEGAKTSGGESLIRPSFHLFDQYPFSHVLIDGKVQSGLNQALPTDEASRVGGTLEFTTCNRMQPAPFATSACQAGSVRFQVESIATSGVWPGVEAQRDMARRLACSAPDGSVGKAAICPNFAAWYEDVPERVRNLCAGGVGDAYQEHIHSLNAEANDYNIEAWATLETEYFQKQSGCTSVLGAMFSRARRIGMMKAERDAARRHAP